MEDVKNIKIVMELIVLMHRKELFVQNVKPTSIYMMVNIAVQIYLIGTNQPKLA